jgi:hypothetical protein
MTFTSPRRICSRTTYGAAAPTIAIGFHGHVTVPEAPPLVFALLERDAVTLYVNDYRAASADLAAMPGMESVVVGQSGVTILSHVTDIASLWEAVRTEAPVVMPLKEQWYGLTEFSLADPAATA